MTDLNLGFNQLNGTHILCSSCACVVYESAAECFVAGNALAGAIPTEIGQLTQLKRLSLTNNQPTGASKKLT